jgi:hypothetical protein
VGDRGADIFQGGDANLALSSEHTNASNQVSSDFPDAHQRHAHRLDPGAGFSRALGGPLLGDLFRQQHAVDLAEVIGGALARELAWVQHLFNHGKEHEHLWQDAEEFLAFVDDASGSTAMPLKKARLKNLIDRAPYSPGPWRGSEYLGADSFKSFSVDPRLSATWALAAECDLFLQDADTASESWKPYVEWAQSLNPEHDSIVTFNYDTVLERLGPNIFEIVRPEDPRIAHGASTSERFDKVPVFKLHGSASWAGVRDHAFVTLVDSPLKETAPRAIATPGRTKTAWVNQLLAPLWRAALRKIESAWTFAILGYGFPKTDAEAKMRILGAIERASPGTVKRLDLVLGPDTGRPEARRVLELVRRRMGHSRTVLVDERPDPRQSSVAVVTQHPLWVEDFIGDYHSRTR